jgi:hypothetical protein
MYYIFSVCYVFTSCLVMASNATDPSGSMFMASCLHWVSPHCSSWAELTDFQLPNSRLDSDSTPLTDLNSVGRVISPRSGPNRKCHSSVDVGGVVSHVPLPGARPLGNTTSHCSPTVAQNHCRCRRNMFLCCVCNHCYVNKLFTVL